MYFSVLHCIACHLSKRNLINCSHVTKIQQYFSLIAIPISSLISSNLTLNTRCRITKELLKYELELLHFSPVCMLYWSMYKNFVYKYMSLRITPGGCATLWWNSKHNCLHLYMKDSVTLPTNLIRSKNMLQNIYSSQKVGTSMMCKNLSADCWLEPEIGTFPVCRFQKFIFLWPIFIYTVLHESRRILLASRKRKKESTADKNTIRRITTTSVNSAVFTCISLQNHIIVNDMSRMSCPNRFNILWLEKV